MNAANKATEVVADVAEEVSDQAQEVADISRGLSGRDVGLVFTGLAIGTGLGGSAVYFFARRRLETKFSQIADEEIATFREHYQNKVLALEATADKGALDEIVRDRGYVVEEEPRSQESSGSPMAITPPDQLVEAAREAAEEAAAKPSPRPKPKPSVPVEAAPEAEVRNIFQEHGDSDADHDWNYAEEKKRRSPDRPYVIHVDERKEFEYDEVTITYYAGDDVLCNERDEIMDEIQREAIVGEENLSRFGHGSEDPNIVYIRNDALEIQYEIVMSQNTYAEEVAGFSHDDGNGRNIERMRARERRQAFDDDEDRWRR